MKQRKGRWRRIRLPRALLAQSDFELRSTFAQALERAAYDVTVCLTANDFLSHIDQCSSFDLIVCDFRWLETINVLGGLSTVSQRPPLVLVDPRDEASAERLRELCPKIVIRKPFDLMRNVSLFRVMAITGERRPRSTDNAITRQPQS